MAEIKLHATTGRALGNGPSRRIRAEADSRRAQILAKAQADATRIRAEGELSLSYEIDGNSVRVIATGIFE